MPTYNNALTNQPANRLAFPSSIGPVPRNEYLGALADFLAKSYSPERTQQMQGISQLLGMPAVSRTLDMMSYGDPLTTGAGGLGGTTRVKPDVLEAAMTVAPLGKPATMATLQAARLARQAAMETGRFVAPKAGQLAEGYMQRMGMMPSIVPVEGAGLLGDAAGKFSDKAIKATEGMPVGMSIKDVDKGITSNILKFTGFKNTTPYGKAKEVAAYLDRLNIPYTINKSKTTNSAYLEIQTGKGDFDYPMQFRFSDHSTDLPHQNRQIFTNPKPDPNFDLDVFKDGGHDAEFATNKINEFTAKINPITTNPKSNYPQQAALDLAQQRAALPVEQGGLGLAAGNTAEQRAAAMGGKDMVHFSRAGGDYTTLDSGKFAIAPFDAVGTHVGTPQAAMERFQNTVGYKVNNPNYANDELKGATYPVTILGNKPLMNQNGMPFGEDDLNAFLRQQGGHNYSDIHGGKMTYQDMNADLRKKLFEEQGYTSIPYYNEVEGKGSISYIVPPENIRSRFAAFDPFRRSAAIAATAGVAAPDLLAAEDDKVGVNKMRKLKANK